jgi:hypothetical protein
MRDKKQEFDFETWYDIAKDEYTQAGFVGLPLDRDAARDAFKDWLSPEEYIQQLVDENN